METKVCATCGRELSLDHYAKNHFGLAASCKECNGRKIAEGKAFKNKVVELEKALANAKNARLQDFQPRELMEELRRRGYEGKLSYTETHTIDLATI